MTELTVKQDLSKNPNFTPERVKLIYKVLDYYVNIVSKSVAFLSDSREDFIQEVLTNLVTRKGYKDNTFENIDVKNLYKTPFANFIRQVAYNHLKNKQRDYSNKVKYLENGQEVILSLNSSSLSYYYDNTFSLMDFISAKDNTKERETLEYIVSRIEEEPNERLKELMTLYMKLMQELEDKAEVSKILATKYNVKKKELSNVTSRLVELIKETNCFVVTSEQEKALLRRRYLVNKSDKDITVIYNGETWSISAKSITYIEDTRKLSYGQGELLALKQKVIVGDKRYYAVDGDAFVNV